MRTKSLQTHLKLLYCQIPLLGGWLRRRSARVLARDGAPEAIRALAEAVVGNDDNRVREIALAAISEPMEQRCVDAVCAVWATTRNSDLAALLTTRQWIAVNPIEVKVLSALLTGRLEGVVRSGEAVVAPLVSACLDQDPKIADQARLVIGKLSNAKARAALANHICAQWATMRLPQLEEIMAQGRYVASQPAAVRALSALKIGQRQLLSDDGAEIVEPLLDACQDPDSEIAEQAQLALRRMRNEAAKEILCRFVVERDHATARAAAREAGYAPRDERDRALFLFLTEQWEQYEALDFDRRLLRSVYEAADAGLRQRITEKLRASGRAEFLTVIAGGDYRSRAAVMTQSEADFLVQMLAEHGEWSKLWTLAFDLSFGSSVRIIRLLAQNGWKPEPDDERMAFDELVELASGEMAMSGDEISRHLPPAIERARVRVAGRVNDVAFAPRRQVIAIGTGQRKVGLWNFQRGAMESALDGFDHSLSRVVFLPDGTLLCAERTRAEEPCAIRGWRDGRGFKLTEHRGSITALESVGESQALATGRDSSVALWDVESGRRIARMDAPNWARGARVSFDGASAILLYDGVALASLPNMKNLIFTAGWVWDGTARCAAFAPDDGAVIVGKFNGEALVCRREESFLMIERHALFHHSAQVQGVETLRERSVVITAGADGSVQFTSWANRASIGSLKIRGERLTSLRVSPDGSFMAIGDSDASMSLWDLRALDVPMLFVRPLVKAVPAQMAVIRALAESAKLDPQAQRALKFLECLLRHRFRYDIEVDEVPVIQAGEFDIEIEG
ncbi:MAG TPA: hypothetical protein VJ810_03625 [Blastocatellia bacterium]|nr:hypothetical protein [Blastocatellia bacterium]